MKIQEKNEKKTCSPIDTPLILTRPRSTRLNQWPCKLSRLPVEAPYLNGAELLIAGDCSAFAYSNFHEELMRGQVTLICCPAEGEEKIYRQIREILNKNEVRRIKVARMEVSCCMGLVDTVLRAVRDSGRNTAVEVTSISTVGRIIDTLPDEEQE